MDDDGYIMLADFGMSKMLKKDFNRIQSKTAENIGAADYVAPEMLAR